ncbi:hypothetical protein BH20ACT9_BH20ACT9_23230 [soil metagenome]
MIVDRPLGSAVGEKVDWRMISFTNDARRTAAQITGMVALEGRDRRLGLLRRMAGRRAATRREVGGGLTRVALRLVNTLDGRRDPVLVVPGRIVVPEAQRDDATNFLTRRGWLEDSPAVAPRSFAGRDQVAELPITTAVDLPTVLKLMRAEGLQAGANHIAALGGRAKGGSTPKHTDHVLADREPVDLVTEPLIIVIDSGIDRAAVGDAHLPELNRTDGWLDGVEVHDAPAGFDPLDVVDYAGNDGADGFLDLAAGHGTFVAGLIRQHAPAAPVRIIRALDTDGYGSETAIEAAIDRARDMFTENLGGPTGQGILNLSLGMETIDGEAPSGIADAIAALPDTVITVAAAGNGPSGIPVWPAALSGTNDHVIAVASASRTPGGELIGSSWSNFGDWVTVSAVGEGVISTFVDGTETRGSGADDDPYDPCPDEFHGPNAYASWSGTSFSAARITGEIAARVIDGHSPGVVAAVDDLTRDQRPDGRYGVLLDI